MVGRSIPVCIKQNRSILLPKGEENLDNINNWRPLTISSVILRLYTSLIAKRVLTSYKINPRQRGFIEASGCSENSTLLSAVIDHAKRNHRELHVTFLDLAKAFDTVSHKHIVAGLQRFSTPTQFIDIVKDMYCNVTTSFQCGIEKTNSIPMTRGVKQGDPLSSLLFNIAMDPLLEKIDSQDNGYRFGQSEEDTISSFCYADDNALTTNTIK
jgi:retron-type reverse transcriptase